MKRLLISLGIAFWVVVLLVVMAGTVLSITGADAPAWLQWFPGVGKGEGNMVALSGTVSLRAEERFSAQDFERLQIGTSYQNINLSLTEGDEIVLRYYDYENAYDWELGSSGGTLSAKTDTEHVSFSIFGFGAIGNPPRIEMELPRSYARDVELQCTSGSVDIAGSPVWDTVRLSASSGSLRLGDGLSCGALSLNTSSGGIKTGTLSTASLSAKASSGSIRLGKVDSRGAVSLESTSGSIDSGGIDAGSFAGSSSSGFQSYGSIRVSGAVTMFSSSGNLSSGDISAASFRSKSSSGSQHYASISVEGGLSAESSSGDITMEGSACAHYDIRTGSGSAKLHGNNRGMGSLQSSSGGVTLEGFTLDGDTQIGATSGSVKVTMAPGQGYRLEATVGSGSIRAGGIQLSYRDERGRQGYATVGDGGAGHLIINTSSGSIRIE